MRVVPDVSVAGEGRDDRAVGYDEHGTAVIDRRPTEGEAIRVREAPPQVTDTAVLAVVRDQWRRDVDEVEHLPVGFGAWHWQARAAGQPVLFATLDPLGIHHSADSLEATYAAAAELAGRGLAFVVPPVPRVDGGFTVGFGADALSATPWHDGSSGHGALADEAAAVGMAQMLAALHAESPPAGLPRWHPLVGPDLPQDLAARSLSLWMSGAHGEAARAAIRERLDDIEHWTARYVRLSAATDPETWVPTHGEPHTRNQLITEAGTVLVDWESLRLAPRERDLRWLAPYDLGGAEPAMVEMFDLEWRLDEISQYADRFQAPHVDTESDRVALAGLLQELDR